MKKKSMLPLMFCLFCIILTGCSESKYNSEVSTEADGTEVTVEDSGTRKNVHSIPYDKINYNEDVMTLKSIDIYQEKSSSGHGYFPYVVVRLDTSTMSEDGLYWMMKDQSEFGLKTFDTSVYISSEKNKIDFDNMSYLYGWYSDDAIVSIYWLHDEYKYDFSDANFTVFVDIKQDETYKYDKTELQKTNSYTWYINKGYDDGIELPVQNEENMPEDVLDGIQKGYRRIYNELT